MINLSMSNPEGGMPPEAQLEAHRKKVQFRLGKRAMGYPELWTPAETEEEKRLVEEAAAEEFTKAVNERDFARADSIAQNLRRQFGEPLLEVSSQPTEPEAERQPSAVEQEMKNIIGPHWEKVFDAIRYAPLSDPRNLALAAEARKFDQTRFDAEITLDERSIKDAVQKINGHKDSGAAGYFFCSAISLKRLVGAEEFAKLVPMNEEDWRRLTEDMKIYSSPYSLPFQMVLADMAEFDPQKTRELIGEEKMEESKKIMREKMKHAFCIHKVFYLHALKLWGQKGEDISVLSQQDWQNIRNEMEDMLCHRDMKGFFYIANMVREVGVEESEV
ncbi:MAG: hypothetical protein UX57_C0011G0014 [Candidatus Uhrbacteria bacterium GW2011_GWE2_46_68]|uniref:Uncharacterized protein n=2 Tax=Candidatus Uhriibacteriota TaxID=1752732 RepID=A0A0G1SF80_9BACT|nr:MAG: hypothetical protein UX45_C0013G0008 [Candidatus Uhrbacteria bacterium GW2011_GWF2_46_218]KKU40728.1 MAG: hypothetical protein UX57_C0011G0014 [Candidatus Uhrbacteria bacterium GW2011_GWE2_46_68]